MDLAAPRSTEEAQEIERRGQLKFGYFTNFVRLRIDSSPTIYLFSPILSKIDKVRFFDREKQWLDGLTTVDPDELT